MSWHLFECWMLLVINFFSWHFFSQLHSFPLKWQLLFSYHRDFSHSIITFFSYHDASSENDFIGQLFPNSITTLFSYHAFFLFFVVKLQSNWIIITSFLENWNFILTISWHGFAWTTFLSYDFFRTVQLHCHILTFSQTLHTDNIITSFITILYCNFSAKSGTLLIYYYEITT